jgi:RNA polymerase sigma factor (sigma-70 family)
MSNIDSLTDSELVTAYLAGDRGAFAGIYDRYASRVFSYALGMIHHRGAAADASHDTFIEVARRLDQLDRAESLRPWLFSIARAQTKRRARDREPERQGSATSVDEPDLRERVWAATDGLGERDRQLVALHLTEGLEGDDLAVAMGVESTHLPVMVSRMADRVAKALGPFLVARVENGDSGAAMRVLREVLPGIMIVPAPPALRPRVLDKVDQGILDETNEKVAAAPAPALQSRSGQEWIMYAAFAVVALVVGLIGVAVSGQFEPLDPSATIPDPDPPPAAVGSTTTTSTTLASSTTTRSGPATTTASTQPAAPAEIEASTATIDLGSEGSAGQFDLTNTGGQPGQWRLEPSSDAIGVSAGEGELAGGDSTTIEVSLDREALEEGEFTETVSVSWGDETIEIAVVGTHEANPIIHNPVASPSSVEVSGDPECQNTQTTVSARVRDNSPLESVVVEWSPDGSSQRETAMTSVGDEMYEAVIGPFTSAQSTSVRVIAFDERGNAGGATTPLTVVACP